MTPVLLGLHTKELTDDVPLYNFTNTLLKGVEGRTLIKRVNSYVELRVICVEHAI